jgi:hypothetical protein
VEGDERFDVMAIIAIKIATVVRILNIGTFNKYPDI